MNVNVTTLFDKNYVLRTLAFYDALRKISPEYKFWFLCLDAETKETMSKLNLPNVELTTLQDLNDKELEATKKDRSPIEFTFTAKSVFVDYVAQKIPDGEALIFADNDVIFFLSPEELLERMVREEHSIGLTLHRFPAKKAFMNDRVGKYNAGLLFFILDKNSRQCISDWHHDCIEWCYMKYEKERFGDQLYMNKWPQRYSGVYEIPDKGINTGTWNLYNWKTTKNDGKFFIDGDPLVCYHFHRIKFYTKGSTIKPVPIYVFHKELYGIYVRMLDAEWEKLTKVFGSWKYGFVEKPMTLRLWKQHISAWLRRTRGTMFSE